MSMVGLQIRVEFTPRIRVDALWKTSTFCRDIAHPVSRGVGGGLRLMLPSPKDRRVCRHERNWKLGLGRRLDDGMADGGAAERQTD